MSHRVSRIAFQAICPSLTLWNPTPPAKGDRGRQPGRKLRGGKREERGREAGLLTGRKRVNFRNISLYFGIDQRQRGGNGYGKGRDAGVKGTGSRSNGRREVQTPGHNFRSSSQALRKISFKRRQFIYFKNGMKLSTNRPDSFKFYDVLISEREQ